MSVLHYLLLFITVVTGGAIAFYFRKNNEQILKSALSFGGAFILGISVLHLMPEVYEGHDHSIGIWVLIGFLLQLVLEQLSGGVEHGHIHASQKKGYGFALQVMLGLCLHAFLEGMPLGGHIEGHEAHYQDVLYYSIIIHKMPAAFALVLLLLLSGYAQRLVWCCLFSFAIMSPLGALFSDTLSGAVWFTPTIQKSLLALAVGSFLHIATTILFESGSRHHEIAFSKIIAIFLGITAALLSSLYH